MTPAPSADLRYNTIDEIQSIHRALRNSFNTGKTIDVGLRKHQLKQLSFLLNDNVEAIAEAISKDLGRCRFESVFAEIMLTTNSVLEAVSCLGRSRLLHQADGHHRDSMTTSTSGRPMRSCGLDPSGRSIVLQFAKSQRVLSSSLVLGTTPSLSKSVLWLVL